MELSVPSVCSLQWGWLPWCLQHQEAPFGVTLGAPVRRSDLRHPHESTAGYDGMGYVRQGVYSEVAPQTWFALLTCSTGRRWPVDLVKVPSTSSTGMVLGRQVTALP